MQYGHLVGRNSLSVCLILAGGAAHCGSTGWWCGGGGGDGGGGVGRVAAAAAAAAGGGGACATSGRRGGLFLFGLLTGKLGDAEDELETAQFDVAAVVEEGRALPARPAASDQAGAARLAAARQLGATLGLAAHHAAGRKHARREAGALVVLALLTATCAENTGRHLETGTHTGCDM